jgi:hypothetical protein
MSSLLGYGRDGFVGQFPRISLDGTDDSRDPGLPEAAGGRGTICRAAQLCSAARASDGCTCLIDLPMRPEQINRFPSSRHEGVQTGDCNLIETHGVPGARRDRPPRSLYSPPSVAAETVRCRLSR